MSRLLQHRYLIRRNLFGLIIFSLCLYFGYHALQGERGIQRLSDLNSKIETMSHKHDSLLQRRTALESRVVRLRPGTVDVDFLEEKARKVLGYKAPDELVLLQK